jgi:hypothetical protein
MNMNLVKKKQHIITGHPVPKPERHYFPLHELGERWQITFEEMRYYGEHGTLKMQAWLGDLTVKIYLRKKTEDGDLVPVANGIRSYSDYAIVEPYELRKIFRETSADTSKFVDPSSGELLKLHRCRYKIGIDDLMISRIERDRFEREHDILPHIMPFNAHAPSFAGRPSIMHQIIAHFEERLAAGVVAESTQRESIYLSTWAKKNLPGVQVPQPKSIANAIRAQHRKAQADNPKITVSA